RRAIVAFAVAMLVLAAEPLRSAVAHDRLAARTDTRVLASRWLAEHATPGANVRVLGSRFWPWGVPQIPPNLHAIDVPPTSDALAAAKVAYVVTHDHTLFSSHVPPALMATLAPRLHLLADFDPFVPGRAGEAVFEMSDAYYIPFHGFGAVTRPGPHVR